jgi:hypothetical protein
MSDWKFILLLVLSLVFGGAYTMLGLRARNHLNEKASNSDRSIGWLFWWSFAPELYDAEGKRMCRRGQLLAVPVIALYVAWYVFGVAW